MNDLLRLVKKNLILEHNEDDSLLITYIASAISYAEGYQHHPDGFYQTNEMTAHTKQAVVMLASHFYESRDGGTGGFFGTAVSAARESWNAVNCLLRLDRDWKV